MTVTKADKELLKYILDAVRSICVIIDRMPDDAPELRVIAKHREDAERPLLKRIEKLEAENQKQAAEIERFRKSQLLGEAFIQIVGELAALIPLKDTIHATENGRAMVDYFRQALGKTQ